jgi:hypothetical protein
LTVLSRQQEKSGREIWNTLTCYQAKPARFFEAWICGGDGHSPLQRWVGSMQNGIRTIQTAAKSLFVLSEWRSCKVTKLAINRALIFLTFVASMTAGAAATESAPKLTASQIVDKNVAARGGLTAWRSVTSMVVEGKMDAGGNRRPSDPAVPPRMKKMAIVPTDSRPKEEVQLPFKLILQRSRKARLELLFNGQTALQVFDGVNGWKLRPYLNRRVVEPFTAEELHAASSQAELDGYLIDYAAKNIGIELEGMEKVEDRDAYKLKLTLRNGRVLHDWIDTQTFLEAKIEGEPRRLDGILHAVEIHYRDYRQVGKLQIPFLLETSVLPVEKSLPKPGVIDIPLRTERIVLEKVEVNPDLDAALFTKPAVETVLNAHP